MTERAQIYNESHKEERFTFHEIESTILNINKYLQLNFYQENRFNYKINYSNTFKLNFLIYSSKNINSKSSFFKVYFQTCQ